MNKRQKIKFLKKPRVYVDLTAATTFSINDLRREVEKGV